MRKLLIFITLSTIVLCSCTNRKRQLEGVWSVHNISFPAETQLLESNIEEINKKIYGIKYEFRNDTMFIADTLASFYTKTDSTFTLKQKNGSKESYNYTIKKDSLTISNQYFAMKMLHSEK